MFPAFTNFALLAGLGAIVAPILIHLLLKRKSQRMKFSSIQFFLKQDEQSMRRRKLRNLLLLATRVLLFAVSIPRVLPNSDNRVFRCSGYCLPAQEKP